MSGPANRSERRGLLALATLRFCRGVIDQALPLGGGVLVEAALFGGEVVGEAGLFGGPSVVTPSILVGGHRGRVGQPVSAVWPRISRWV